MRACKEPFCASLLYGITHALAHACACESSVIVARDQALDTMCVPPPPRENWIQEEPENRELEEVPIETIEAQIRRLQRVLADRDAVVAARRRRLEEIRREAREAAAGAQN